MARIFIGLLIGLVLGGAIVFYFFVGAPRAAQAPGAPISAPDPAGPAAGTAQVVLRQEFFNTVLESILTEMNAPTFPLTLSGTPDAPGSECSSEITVLREGSGVQTAVRFDNNTLSAPMAFSGRYNSLFGCLQFTGWSQANLQLRYDNTSQTVFGQINVETVNLDGVNPVVSGILTPLVQTSINNRVTPITIVDGKQVAVSLPIAATNANLNASVTDVRAEIKENALHLFLVYDFQGAPLVPAQ